MLYTNLLIIHSYNHLWSWCTVLTYCFRAQHQPLSADELNLHKKIIYKVHILLRIKCDKATFCSCFALISSVSSRNLVSDENREGHTSKIFFVSILYRMLNNISVLRDLVNIVMTLILSDR